MQSVEDPFPMLDFATGHDPQTMKRRNAAPGEKDALLCIDNTGND
jgi:hypothetical protein